MAVTSIDSKSGNHKYPRLSFVQYLETGASEDIKLYMNVSNENLHVILQNARFRAFTISELLRENLLQMT